MAGGDGRQLGSEVEWCGGDDEVLEVSKWDDVVWD